MPPAEDDAKVCGIPGKEHLANILVGQVQLGKTNIHSCCTSPAHHDPFHHGDPCHRDDPYSVLRSLVLAWCLSDKITDRSIMPRMGLSTEGH